MFVDETLIEVTAGRGGDGAIGFRREKYVPLGGPDGGDGGRGGHVVLQASKDLHTLYDIGNRRHFKAPSGIGGSGSLSTGKSGEDVVLLVPVGTLVKDPETGDLLADLKADGETFMAAKGGRGGLGNNHFKSSIQQTPRKATPGEPGEKRRLQLELKLMADCGLVGLPNAGKSSLIRKLSAATPKVADYPFTTLKPVLGMVRVGDGASFVLVDIPGLIEGAADGKGLGHQFLRHVERTSVLCFVVDISMEGAYEQFEVLRGELGKFHPQLLEKPYLIALNKNDLGEYEIDERFTALKCPLFRVSALTGEGLEPLKQEAFRQVLAKGPRNASTW
jgi:GTPase